MRKNTQLLIAYTMLFASATGAVCYDAHIRANQPVPLSEAEMKAAERRENGNTVSRVVVSSPNVASSEIPAQSQELAHAKRATSQLPRGVFVVKDTTSAKATDGTMHDLTAGTQVILLRREGEKMKVTCDGFDYLVEENQVTRNMEAVGKLLAQRKS